MDLEIKMGEKNLKNGMAEKKNTWKIIESYQNKKRL